MLQVVLTIATTVLALYLPNMLLSSLLGLVGLASVPLASAYDDNANIKSIPVCENSCSIDLEEKGGSGELTGYSFELTA